MNIQIFGQDELIRHIERGGATLSHCISITNPGKASDPRDTSHETPELFRKHFKGVLELEFWDSEDIQSLSGYDNKRLADQSDIDRILAFVNKEVFSPTGFTIHCWRGIARSAAVAFGLLYSELKDEKKAADELVFIRRHAMPLKRILELFDERFDSNLSQLKNTIYKARFQAMRKELETVRVQDDFVDDEVNAKFGTYFHKETCETSRPVDDLEFIGYSLPYYNLVREMVERKIGSTIPLHKVDFFEYTSVHIKEYVELIRAAERGDDIDIPTSGECHNLQYAIPGYEYSLGGVYKILEMMKEGDLERAYCFTLPSHHAYPAKSHGYCLLNSMAAGIRYGQTLGFEKVLIVDWDIHHGDGTQTIFENDKKVHHISIHSAVDLYMNMVKATELGTTVYGEFVGQVNIPVLDKHFSDDFYYDKLEMAGDIYRADQAIARFRKALNSIPFSPDLIVVFDGHDSHKEDCGKGVTDWDYEDFETLTKLVIDKSIDCNCPILSMPGGGYNLKTAVELSIQHVNLLKNYKQST